MGIRLDWEIQAEQAHVQNGGEDPEAARKRRLARLRLLLVIGVVLLVVGGGVAAVTARLHEVDSQIEGLLRDTVQAEIAALRIGDQSAFLDIQHRGNVDWVQKEQVVFNNYQSLKTKQQTMQLTGNILNVTIDGRRGRVQVEEIIDGIPYVNTWFYWNFPPCENPADKCKESQYQEGWRHVPPDYTFWGDAHTYVGKAVTVHYRQVDDTFAVEMGLGVEKWLQMGCEALVCGAVPSIEIDIAPDDGLQMGWAGKDSWHLQVPSPYLHTARSDMPFDGGLQIQTATLVAERLLSSVSNDFQPTYPADVYYLRSAVVSWLVGKFVSINTNSFLIGSLADHYGVQSVGLLVKFMQPNANVSILSLVTNASSLDQANLDWRDFLTWRLVTEDELIARRDDNNFLAFYDTRDTNTQQAAYRRFNAIAPAQPQVVVLAQPEKAPDGTAQLRATVQVGKDAAAHQEQVLFRLVDNVWRRAS